jgi:hypothetical protein
MGLRECFPEVRILKEIGEKRLKVESLKSEEEKFGELNTETQSTRSSEAGTDLQIKVGRGVELAAIIRECSTIVTDCQ